ncbi:LpqB family beta-propeller domain-containing protein [Streptomyces sp. YIM S03343]
MGADRAGSPLRRPGRAAACAAFGVVLLAGCASMPDNGDLRDVASTPRQDTQVRVFAMPPREDALPAEIVQGFLEALTSDDPHYDTARKYLTADAAHRWQPERSTTVLENGPSIELDRAAGGRESADSLTYLLTGNSVSTVDTQQAYSPTAGGYSKPVHLVRDTKSDQWRIDGLPQGIVMARSDFQRNYMSVNKYYFASDTASGSQPAAVADPVYVRERVDPMTQVVRSLLNGPTTRLSPVVRSSFPTDVALRKGVASLTPDDQNKLTVPLNVKPKKVAPARCTEMATQILFTLQSLTPTVDTVELEATDGSALCTLDEDHAEAVAAHGAANRPENRPEYVYFLDDKHRLVRIPAGSTVTTPETVPGALGEGVKPLESVAVSRDEHTAAGVTTDGRSLYVASVASSGSLGEPVLVSNGKTAEDGLTAPSWDSRGDLWVADRDTAAPRLVLLQQGSGQPLTVRTPQLDGRIVAVRVAADGTRIALRVEKNGQRSLLVGRIQRTETKPGKQPDVAVLDLRSVAPDLEDVTAMSWAGDSRLVVVGNEHGGLQQMRYAQVDGSVPEGQAPAAVTGVKEIAASEDDRMPLVAHSEDGIVRLPSGAQWQKLVKAGSGPVYPG